MGTVAAGVAKAYADYVLIAGHNGGTGASPLSSIKHAGSPWELGLAEAQQTLVRNGLRHRIEVRTDGGLKTGRDVVIAALLGAESYGFGTAPLVAMGCAMARQCHLEHLSHRHRHPARRPARQVQGHAGAGDHLLHHGGGGGAPASCAEMGCRSLRRDHRPERPAGTGRASRSAACPDARSLRCCSRRRHAGRLDRRCAARRRGTTRPGAGLARRARSSPSFSPTSRAACRSRVATRSTIITSRSGARVSGAIVERRGRRRAASGIGAAAVHGHPQARASGRSRPEACISSSRVRPTTTSGKGLSGGEITIRPFRRAAYADASHQHLILGNTVLYGATAGRLFAAGQVGDRFAVRNSGAIAVIEGAGNHCCEYMTGGIVVGAGPRGAELRGRDVQRGCLRAG